MKTKLAISRSALFGAAIGLASVACATAEELDEDLLAVSHSKIDYDGENEFAVDSEQSASSEQPSAAPPASDSDFPAGDPLDEPSDPPSGGEPLADAGSLEPMSTDDEPAQGALGEPPESMTWETCDPAWAAHFCPDLACDTTAHCSDGQAMYEPDCRLWCTNILDCVTARKSCIEPDDPLCVGEYFPRDKCIDYIDPDSEKSAGSGEQKNYKDSWGNKAAIALLECACGGQ